jgi:signal transduction histidine kinase
MGALNEIASRAAAADESMSAGRRFEQSRIHLFFAAIIPLFAFTDSLAAGQFVSSALAIRALWALALVLFSVRLKHATEREHGLLLIASSALSAFALVAIPMVAGGPTTFLFAWNLAVPVGVAALLKDDWRPVLASWLVTTFASSGALLYAKASFNDVALWLVLCATAGVVSFAAALWQQRLRRAELRVQEQLEASELRRIRGERLAVIGQLAASLAHEINNPLQTILMHLAVLSARDDLGADVSKRVKLIESGANHIRQIVHDFKTQARGDVSSAEDCSVGEVIEDALRLARIRLDSIAKVEVDLPAKLPFVRVKKRELCQAVLNVLMNAADSLEENRFDGARVNLSVHTRARRTFIVIEDNGPGIPSTALPHLFEPFFSTKDQERGTGLGLTVSREILERFGGKLRGENVAPRGARFTLELPIAETDARSFTPSERSAIAPRAP